MTHLDHISHVRALASSAMNDGDGPVCVCPTCGLTTLLLRSTLAARDWSAEDTRRVTIESADFRGGHAYLAGVEVDGKQVYRIEHHPHEVLDRDVIADIESALHRGDQ